MQKQITIMNKIIHYIVSALIILAFTCNPTKAFAQDVQRTQPDMEQNAITILCQASTIHVKNADHMVLEVYGITGEKVYTIRIDSPSKSIDLSNLSRGWYIIKIGPKCTRKIYLK